MSYKVSSPEGIKVISCKRNADVNLHLNLQVNLNLVTNVTYAHTHVHTYGRNIKAKRYMPNSCQRQEGAKKFQQEQMYPHQNLSFSTAVTLKMRSMSSKSICYQFFVMPQLYIHENLVEANHLFIRYCADKNINADTNGI